MGEKLHGVSRNLSDLIMRKKLHEVFQELGERPKGESNFFLRTNKRERRTDNKHEFQRRKFYTRVSKNPENVPKGIRVFLKDERRERGKVIIIIINLSELKDGRKFYTKV